jgi:cell division septum initiation protein DivIVA
LELAARIGQSLLKKNKTLTERNELLEEQVEHIREEVRSCGSGGHSWRRWVREVPEGATA